jgi:hypothetical protein
VPKRHQQQYGNTAFCTRPGLEGMGLGERIKNVLALKKEGKSNRAIAHELDVNEGSIRRIFKIAALPQEDIEAIEEGASVKKILAQARIRAVEAADKQKREEAEAKLKRLLEDKAKTEALSQRVGDALVQWLQGNDLRGPFAEQLVCDVDRRLARRERSEPIRVWPRQEDVPIVIEHCRPANPKGDKGHWLNGYIQWAEGWVGQAVPPGIIRDTALAKARRWAERNPRE